MKWRLLSRHDAPTQKDLFPGHRENLFGLASSEKMNTIWLQRLICDRCKARKIHMPVRKALSFSLALDFVLVTTVVMCQGVCWARCDTVGPRTVACSGPLACPCDLSQRCRLELPDFSVSALPKVQDAASAQVRPASVDILACIDFAVDFTNKVSTFATNSLYILNLSLLC